MGDNVTIFEALNPKEAASAIESTDGSRTVVVVCDSRDAGWSREELSVCLGKSASEREGPLVFGFHGAGRISKSFADLPDIALISDEVQVEGEDPGVVQKAKSSRDSIVVDPSDFRDAVRELAGRLSDLAPKALSAAKRAVREGGKTDIDQGLVIENRLFASLFETEDMREGTSAFLEKRQPHFRGR